MTGAELALPDSTQYDAGMIAHYLAPARRSPATVRIYSAAIAEFTAFTGCPLSRVNVDSLGDWLSWLKSRNLGASAMEQRVSVIRGLLRQAHDAFPDLYRVNVGALQSFKPPRRGETGCPRVLSREQVQALIFGEPEGRNRLMLLTLYGLGLRVSELCAMTWQDFGADGSELRVLGKGNKLRTVAVPVWLWNLLDLNAPGAELKQGRVWNLSRQRAWVIVKRAAKGAGLENISPHWLRHACASHLLESGATLAEVGAVLGHSRASTTAIYLHATRGRVVAEALKITEKETPVKVT